MAREDTLKHAFYLDENFKKNISLLQEDDFFIIRFNKLNRLNNLRQKRPFENNWPLITERKWEGLIDDSIYKNIQYIDTNYFENCTDVNLKAKTEYLNQSIVLVSNSVPQSSTQEQAVITLKNYQYIYDNCPDTLFLGWDWDNHHHLHVSSIFASTSDIYFPTHLANDYELSRFCSKKFLVPSSSHQWGRLFLTENIDCILRKDRLSEVFGRFVRYGLFGHRNKAINRLSTNLKYVELVDDLSSYKMMTQREKLNEWTSYKCHWVVPTLNDMSTRIFDALITGGVIIIPEIFKSDPVISRMDKRDCFFYAENDIFDPIGIVSHALSSFDKCGLDGVLRRHRYALDNHNLDSRVKEILTIAKDVLTTKD